MRILLAPMEGVLDHTLRALLTRDGDFDRCVTEFVRVTDTRLPRRVFLRSCPELDHGCRTPSGTPVYLQLLGGQPGPMARNAAHAVRQGARAIDLNFGCPAKTVNRHDGGSILLCQPERVHTITAAVRAAVPAALPVTVKIRLGYRDHGQLRETLQGIEAAGASELVIHARTRDDGYKPPAWWAEVGRVRQATQLPLVINGEIWTPADALRAREESGCEDIMLGRGVLANPGLARDIRASLGQCEARPLAWCDAVTLLQHLLEATLAHYPVRFAGNPVKQWLGYLRRHYPQAGALFDSIRRLREPEALRGALCRAAGRRPESEQTAQPLINQQLTGAAAATEA